MCVLLARVPVLHKSLASTEDGLVRQPVGPTDSIPWVRFDAPTWLHRYDYSSAAGCRLIASVPSRTAEGHCGADRLRWGQMKLQRLLLAAMLL